LTGAVSGLAQTSPFDALEHFEYVTGQISSGGFRTPFPSRVVIWLSGKSTRSCDSQL
jgi:hypothetical protein